MDHTISLSPSNRYDAVVRFSYVTLFMFYRNLRALEIRDQMAILAIAL